MKKAFVLFALIGSFAGWTMEECHEKGERVIGEAVAGVMNCCHNIDRAAREFGAAVGRVACDICDKATYVAVSGVGAASMSIEELSADIKKMAATMRAAGALLDAHAHARLCLLEKQVAAQWSQLDKDIKEDWEFIQQQKNAKPISND